MQFLSTTRRSRLSSGTSSPPTPNRAVEKNHAFTRFWHSPLVRTTRHLFSAQRWHRYATASMRQLPDFLIAGTQKGGTTSLFAYLCEHPQVVPPLTKEMSFFDNHFSKGLDWYRGNFPLLHEMISPDDLSRPNLTGESTAHYLFHPHAPRRIAESLPGIKIILLLRDPVDRAFSHYQLNVRRGNEHRSFEAAIELESERLRGEHQRMLTCERYSSFNREKYSYLARGRYCEQLRVWMSCFSPEQLLILESGELFRHTAATFDRTRAFLGLSPWQPPSFGNRFPGRYSERMQPGTRRRLIEYFAPHNEQLFSLLGRRFPWQGASAERVAA